MFNVHATSPQPPRVTALFCDGVHSFQLSQGATVVELAERLDLLRTWHASAPIAVRVRLGPIDTDQ